MKVMFLDLEGSLMLHKSVWRELNRIFGFTKEEDYMYYRQMIAEGEGKYPEWIEIVSKKWSEKSPRKSFFDKFFNYKMKFKPEARDFIKKLKEKGIKTVLVSYAPSPLVKKAAEYLGVDDLIVFHDLEFDEKDFFKRIVLKNYADKLSAVVDYLKKNKIHRKDTLGLGDSVTDLKMLKYVNKGFWVGDFPVKDIISVSALNEILNYI